MIKPCTFEIISASGLLEIYADECALSSLPRPVADPEQYKAMIGSGVLKVLGYFQGGILIGFITIMVIPTPHYKERAIAATESFFVHPEYRAGGAGIKLLRAAETLAEGCGSIGLVVSAPAGSNLSKVLAGLDNYRLTNEVYIRGFGECR